MILSSFHFKRSGCTTTTCAACKSASHAPLACIQDANTHALLETARAAGWARCYRCRTLVELTHGCYHMTCRCRAEFCYVCAAPWKTCTCPQWDEQRLLADAQRRVARSVGCEVFVSYHYSYFSHIGIRRHDQQCIEHPM
jgi:hypothetical protein